ncbi:hypothetical protein [Sphaerisporangium fuscum]|uniref:hypothetical protein n=1 Tax=Sphaerisporangium fuscum TaxID=2835868 RepID=UPI001BDD8D12|nr:hypothetical protein [Sphaerisporangium fuscum]
MANLKIEPLELRRMVEAGRPYREIAGHFDVSISGVQQAVERIGLQKKSLSHKDFLPWTLAKQHRHSGPATNLRVLSNVAQGKAVLEVKLNTALRWAARLCREGLDIDYSSDTGFFERRAIGERWHIAMVLDTVDRASASATARLTPSDLAR